MAVQQLRAYLRGQEGSRSVSRLRSSAELFSGKGGKLLIFSKKKGAF